MRVLWIEDHQLVGDSLEVWLQVTMPDVSLDKARDVDAAINLVDGFKYELVLLDWWLGANDGEFAIRALRDAGCRTPIVVVSGDDREPVMRRALELGAVGYVPKTAAPATLLHTMRVAIEGGVSQPRRELQNKTSANVGGALPPIDVEALFPELTPRQAEVFRALMHGHGNKQIARDLGILETTVKTHVQRILEIVGVHKRTEAVYVARSRGARDG
jgi:two-component system nitrate/nitrite response regulator NarL